MNAEEKEEKFIAACSLLLQHDEAREGDIKYQTKLDAEHQKALYYMKEARGERARRALTPLIEFSLHNKRVWLRQSALNRIEDMVCAEPALITPKFMLAMFQIVNDNNPNHFRDSVGYSGERLREEMRQVHAIAFRIINASVGKSAEATTVIYVEAGLNAYLSQFPDYAKVDPQTRLGKNVNAALALKARVENIKNDMQERACLRPASSQAPLSADLPSQRPA